MSDANLAREYKKQQKALNIKDNIIKKEMEQCTFSPRVIQSVQSLNLNFQDAPQKFDSQRNSNFLKS